MFKDSGLKDKVAIVTGGSRGIGRAIDDVLASEGADVTFFYHSNHESAEKVAAEAKQKGQNVTAMCVDVTDKAQCQATIEEIFQRTERIDVLVNNSGIVRDNLLVGLSEDDLNAVLDTNVVGVFNMCQAIVPFMMSQRSGKIINLSSVSAEKGGRGQTNYAASKGAINSMTKALAVELARKKVTVNAVAPGVIETDMSQQVRDAGGDQALNHILLKRFGQPEDIAHAVGFLASKYADYITGEILHVDGGFKMA